MTPAPSILMPDDFHFDSMGTTEDITRYVPGGYHPIAIGDILSPPPETSDSRSRQYRIMHKLGFGSYATAWLAQKADSNEFVAVKITTADDGPTREAAMLEAASEMPTDGGRPLHVLTLLDHFAFHGPNGTHSVLVTDVVTPMLSLLSPKRPPLWRKAAAHGLAQAVAHLHTASIVHGDLHLGNVGLAIPQLADQDPDDVMQDLSPHELTIVLPTSASNQTPSLPAYVVAPCALAAYYDRIARSEHPQTKVYDFGSAHKAGTLPLSFQCAVEACAPELVFARVVEKIDNPPVEPSADVWALGAAIYEIVAGSALFRGIGMTGLLPQMVLMAGSLPPGWRSWYASLSNPPEVSPSGADAWWASRRGALRRNCIDDADTDALIALLRKVLVLDSAARPTAAEVLQDLWFLYAATI
ncbi:kinase-like protein [Leucogyrophana mollusca]|uniref:Kinase-like protein n=1 Tax=Leucogyrophana mollusca TaxID=85980 RepID=A0ACB8BQ54_9AGAM|nr:kinase-like protein [Leucogyrophana mollusca]